ncbi:dTDP-glucose pyrophosphorylase [Silvimonas terrae]|uniref:dTDP-glucose pyrophosphorylase n=1 Tax=Silvimonas terrae TaxID=300266 RepID=A0A840RJP1_9NEIS|nr:glycosyltransferase family 2 protein [Silvimonas terrae]MBB5192462.1 dTDP-glucose pyrophosphorylase [Silvimonas terrae]
MRTPEVVITMAGFGSRFRNAGYDLPKYEIVVKGKTLFAWSMESLAHFTRLGAPFIFVVRAADDAAGFIEKECQALGIQRFSIIELDQPTDGQATSALLAGTKISDPDAPMLIYNIDTYVNPDALPAEAVHGDGWLPCFPGEGSAWSFAELDDQGRVVRLAEKERISPHATVGLYWFSSFNLFRDTYHDFFAEASSVAKGERYIAPMYNALIRHGHPVYIHSLQLQDVVPLGTPADVETFIKANS